MTTDPTAFYDGFAAKLLADYASGNPRAEAAIGLAVAELPGGPMNVLDIGCGIGWSSAEVARHHPQARVLGADLSPRLVDVARSLFGGEPRVRFESRNVVEDEIGGRFDAVLLLDVYEHVPASSRGQVHERLANLLDERGVIVLAVPTPAQQQLARERFPERLQPVDEDVTVDDLERLAADVGGALTIRRTLSIWLPDDYVHAVVRRAGSPPPSGTSARLEDRRARARRIQRSLGLRWSAGSGFLADREGPRICVATSWPNSSFIRAHLERLAGRVHVLHGDLPHRTESGRSILPLPLRATARLAARLLGGNRDVDARLFSELPRRLRVRLYARHLRRTQADVLLAESGPLAVELHDACRRARVPLVAHFHGYDAYQHDVLETHRDAYRAIFSDGHPVVAVSRPMKDQLEALGALPGQVHLNVYGVDLTQFRPGEPAPGRVVSVARLVDKKAPELTLLAFARAAAAVPEAHLVVVGEGPLRATLERLIPALGLQGRVHVEGARSHAEITSELRSAAVFVQHSVVASDGNREGTPVAVLEAGASGLPVVSTRHEGIAEVVVDGETGLLVDEGDIDGMAAALVALLIDPERARRFGEAARRRIEERYSMERSIDGLQQILEQAIGRDVTGGASRRAWRPDRRASPSRSPREGRVPASR
ncbi:MAG TPA: glycosyltransferase [Gaiellaceae bacterium]|nr:glycosyltransferase [Gaiellaceae bacterium]